MTEDERMILALVAFRLLRIRLHGDQNVHWRFRVECLETKQIESFKLEDSLSWGEVGVRQEGDGFTLISEKVMEPHEFVLKHSERNHEFRFQFRDNRFVIEDERNGHKVYAELEDSTTIKVETQDYPKSIKYTYQIS